MRLAQIKYFIKIAELSSISKAAKELYVSQPALTKQMNLLEEEMGVKLMLRLNTGIVLTKAGEKMYKDCVRIVAGLEDTLEEVKKIGRELPPKITIGCFEGATIEDFMPELYAYLEENLGVREIELLRNVGKKNHEDLENDKIDMLIDLRLSPDEKLKKGYKSKVISHRTGAFIYSDKSKLAKKRSLKVDDFKKEKLMVMDPAYNKYFGKASLDTISKVLGIKPEIVFVENFMTLMTNIRYGKGYAIMSKIVADDDETLKAFPLPKEFGADVICVWKEDKKIINDIMKNYKEEDSLISS
ncbi:MAG: LysR family transcriptional regulator [Lachnospiraceae bacterium]|nr:LysR family transcriptional regulator [Lachnospiraceae bacterium]